MGALSHLRIVDLSRILAGPWATQVLGDLGAEVIKIERPAVNGQGGDDTRSWGPPWWLDRDGQREAAYYLATNRNKRSVTIDFTKPEGQELVRQLVAGADVLIENFKVGGLKKYGLDYETLKAVNPRLVYCSITGFGQDGPYADRAGYDFLIQGMGGLMSITGAADGAPQKVGVALTDILTGLYAANAIQAALAHRDRTGEGQSIDIALLDVQIACLANQAMNYLVSGKAPTRLGNEHPNIVPYAAFPTADGHMILTVGNDRQFADFARLAGHPEWSADPRYATNAARVENRVELTAAINAATVARTTSEWVSILEKHAVPCGPINSLNELFIDPQVLHRQMQRHLDRNGDLPQVASPIRLSATPVQYDRPPPALGRDTEAVLGDTLQLDKNKLASLKDRGII
ncbi:MAG TPA: CaiB/BaiF CoA-transferase family protein [Rhodocyclaceae bacterium]